MDEKNCFTHTKRKKTGGEKPGGQPRGDNMGRIAIVALSGGMDSCVAAAIARQGRDLALLHVRYGQRTREREERAFTELADWFRVPRERRLVVSAPHYGSMGGSSLTDPRMEVPRGTPSGTGIPSTYVPFRNAFILSVGVAWAEAIGAKAVFIGAAEPDSSGYPDCRPSFIEAFNRLVSVGTRPGSEIRVEAPLIGLTKAGIVKRGIELAVPFHLTWSCYVSQGPEACGACESCLLRLKGFREAGVKDPIRYCQE